MNITKYEEEDALKVNKAVNLIINLNQENCNLSSKILFDVIKNTPENYVYKFISDRKLHIKFWNKDEFFHFASFKEEVNINDGVLWIASAYPKAYYYFGILLNKAREFDKSIWSYNKGMELEPSNPSFLIGLGNTYSSMANHEKALECYRSVGKISPFISPKFKALALRSEGVQLIELDNLIYARKSLMASLELEPNNQNAINELLFIDEIEKGNKDNFTAPIIGQINAKKNRCMYCLKEVQDGIMRKINNDYYFICKDCANKKQYNG